MEQVVWIMSFKVRILTSSPLAMDDSEYGVAEAVTFAHSTDDARAQLLQQLESAKLELIEFYQNTPFSEAKLIASNEHRDDILQLVEEVKFSREFRFGIFSELEGSEHTLSLVNVANS